MPWTLRTLLTIGLAALPLFLYVGVRCVASLRRLYPRARQRSARVLLLVLGYIYLLPILTLAFHFAGQTRSHPLLGNTLSWLDIAFHYPYWLGLIAVLELTVPFLVIDVALLISRVFRIRSLDQWRRRASILRITIVLGVCLYVPLKAAMDTLSVREDVVRVYPSSLPPELQGLTLVLLGDIQVDRYTGESKTGQMRTIIEARRPDLVLSGGDLVTNGTAFLGEAARAIEGVAGSLGSFAVMGDHDHWSAPASIRDLQEDGGWTFLENAHRVVPDRGKRILISGLTHIYSRRLGDGDLDRFLSGAPKADLRILLVHQPAERVVQAASRHNYDLVLAGHTHGGQIVIHPLGFPLTPSRFESRYFRGVHKIGKTTVVVTNGVGLTLAPVRYGAPSEVTTVILGSEEGGSIGH